MTRGRKWGLFGGSFDPIHCGHLAPVVEARDALGLERVIYLPTAVPPHKPLAALASPFARYAMVELALLDEPGCFVSPRELTVGQPAFTIDTINALRAELPEVSWTLILGSDSFVELVHWRNWREIVATVELAVLTRPGWSTREAALPEELRSLLLSERLHLLETTPVAASSTRLREILRRDEEVPLGWLPTLVLDYIHKYNLYR